MDIIGEYFDILSIVVTGSGSFSKDMFLSTADNLQNEKVNNTWTGKALLKVTEMAMQAVNPAAAVLRPAQIVGNAFVEQYYHILHYSPELVYRLYQYSSVLSRPDSDGTMTSVTTMQAINEKIQSLYSKNYKTEIKTADAQDSYHMGVIVLLTGSLTVRDNVKRKFTQTFFLAPQENGYFVLNDVFRYVDENEQPEINSTSVHGIGHSITVVPYDPEPAHVPANPVSDSSTTLEYENLEDLQNGSEYDHSDNEEGSVYEEEVIKELPSHSSQNDTSSAVVDLHSSPAEGEKKSYASIVKVKKTADATSGSVYVPTSSLRWAPTKTSEKPLTSAIPSPESEASAPTSDSPTESNNAHEIAEGHSIYIRNLPLNATETQIEEEFRKFGPIKHGGVQVRSNKQ